MPDARLLACCGVLLCAAAAASAAEKIRPEELVRRHLEEGLGPADARLKPREVRGTAALATRAVGQGSLGGSFGLASDPLGSRLLIRFGTNDYDGENFAFDGKAVLVGFGQRPSGKRSALGDFLAANDVILREGLLGGVLNAAWPLSSLDARQAKLSYDGLKRFDDRELHRVSYRARRGQNELTIQLWFEPETWRHAASTYVASRAQSMGATPIESSQQSDQFFRLEERFSDFTRALGLTLPRSWLIRYEASTRTTVEWKYELRVESFEAR